MGSRLYPVTISLLKLTSSLKFKKLICTTLLITSHPVFSNEVTCGNNEQAHQLAQLIRFNQQQQRMALRCNEKLNEIALIKAGYIIENQDIWHNAGHMAPNQLLRHHGFKLPKTYPLFGNQVEALAGGEESAKEVFADFLNSKPHKKLLLGEDAFFKSQDQIGVAFVKNINTEHEFYWVVIIADEKNQMINQDPIIDVEPPVISTKKRRRGREIKQKMYHNKVRGRMH